MREDDINLDEILKERGFDFKWITGEEVVVSHWVRMKCTYGCPEYGTKGACPPHVPPVAECREFFREYKKVAIIHYTNRFDDETKRKAWTKQVNAESMELERDVFLTGFHKAFMLTMGSCYICANCAGTRIGCIDKESSRPTPEAFGVDVFATARNCGYPIEVLDDHGQVQHRYALLLVE